MPRYILPVLMIVAGVVLGAGGSVLLRVFWPAPPPVPTPLISAWRVYPLTAQVPLDSCKQIFARAFQTVGLTEVAVEPGDGIQVLGRAQGYIAMGLCMQRRETALVTVTGPSTTVINNLLTGITNVAMATAPPAPRVEPGAPR